jgi:hypothetical protein
MRNKYVKYAVLHDVYTAGGWEEVGWTWGARGRNGGGRRGKAGLYKIKVRKRVRKAYLANIQSILHERLFDCKNDEALRKRFAGNIPY